MAKLVADRRPEAKTRGAAPTAVPAGDPITWLLAPARAVAGVGPQLEARLRRLFGLPSGVAPRRLDLLWHLPYATIDRRLRPNAGRLVEGERVTLEVEVERHAPPFRARHRRGGGTVPPYRVRCRAGTQLIHLTFFHARPAHLGAALPLGARRVVSGRLSRYGDAWQIIHPELILSPEQFATAAPLQPIYPLTGGLGQRQLGRVAARAADDLPEVAEWQDPAWRASQKWPSFAAALCRLHRPAAAADVALDSPARRRLAYDELLANQLALALVRAGNQHRPGRPLVGDARLRTAVISALPFRPTAGQRRALAEILADMARPVRMLRLLQGDVGSGKTLVALLAMLAAVEAGGQAAIMAPTEVLARQQAAVFTRLLAPTGLVPVLLTGRERGALRASRLAALAQGEARIAIGTHALFQPEVAFADLAFVVIDEQHRFGVHQRLDFATKGHDPDVLVMTATPIPRTMVLALYGDMAVAELRDKPPGRQPIRTRVMPLARLDRVLTAVAAALERGERLYWVCPMIGAPGDGDDGTDDAAAEQRFESLRKVFGSQVGLVHGRLPGPARDQVMTRFARGAIRLLVATTVIEVGLDVPEASVIVIERAERFGLAQLHQLRGRVGRGTRPSHCLLLYDQPLGVHARARLEVMRATTDGFRIAEEDLRLRGPGEALGTRQSGLPALRLADLGVHADLLPPAVADARRCLADDPHLIGPRGQALRQLLRLFDRDAAIACIDAG